MIKRSFRKMSYSRLLFFLGVGVAWYSNLPQRYLASRYAYKVESFLLRKEYTKAQKKRRKTDQTLKKEQGKGPSNSRFNSNRNYSGENR